MKYAIYTGWFFYLVRPKNDQVPDPKEILTLRTFLKGFTCNLTLSHFLGGPVKKPPCIFFEVFKSTDETNTLKDLSPNQTPSTSGWSRHIEQLKGPPPKYEDNLQFCFSFCLQFVFVIFFCRWMKTSFKLGVGLAAFEFILVGIF